MEREVYVWKDRRGNRRRQAWLLLVADGRIHRFTGETIPGVAVVVGRDYKKQGWRSHNTYRLVLRPGVRAIPGYDGWETGRFTEGLRDAVRWPQPIDRWTDAANALGVTLSEAKRFLWEWYPDEAAALDKVEEDLVTLDDAMADGADIIAITFGAPRRREIDAGFWLWPVRVLDESGQEVGRVVPGAPGGWDEPKVIGPIRIVGHERVSGRGGGYVSLRLAVPAGCKAKHQQEEV